VAKRNTDFIAMVKEVGRVAPGMKGKIIPKTKEEIEAQAAAKAVAAAGSASPPPASSAPATAGK